MPEKENLFIPFGNESGSLVPFQQEADVGQDELPLIKIRSEPEPFKFF
jgi:hypothetical protein